MHLALADIPPHPLHLMPHLTTPHTCISPHTTPHLTTSLTSPHYTTSLTSPHHTPHLTLCLITTHTLIHCTSLQDLLSLLVSDAVEGQVPRWFREQILLESAQLEPCGTAAYNSDRRDAKRSRKTTGGASRRTSQEGREEIEDGGSVLRVKLQMCDTLYRLLQGEPSSWRWHSALRTAGREEMEAAAEVRLCVHVCVCIHVCVYM